jgi:hypothetical protein
MTQEKGSGLKSELEASLDDMSDPVLKTTKKVVAQLHLWVEGAFFTLILTKDTS